MEETLSVQRPFSEAPGSFRAPNASLSLEGPEKF